jgi:hypothetical protein
MTKCQKLQDALLDRLLGPERFIGLGRADDYEGNGLEESRLVPMGFQPDTVIIMAGDKRGAPPPTLRRVVDLSAPVGQAAGGWFTANPPWMLGFEGALALPDGVSWPYRLGLAFSLWKRPHWPWTRRAGFYEFRFDPPAPVPGGDPVTVLHVPAKNLGEAKRKARRAIGEIWRTAEAGR